MATPRTFIPKGLGWQPDLPDPRDYRCNHPAVSQIVELDLGQLPGLGSLPDRVDLRQDADGIYFTAAKDQGSIHASSVFALLGIVEYGERRAHGKSFDGSARFVFEMAKKISGVTGNANVGLREVCKAVKRYGMPPEHLCPYQSDDGAILQDVSLLGYRDEAQHLTYFRPLSTSSAGENPRVADDITQLRSLLATGLPFAFGFAVPSSLGDDGEIPFRPQYDAYFGGQAVVAVGYDDFHLPGKQGAFLVRNSWGSDWGDEGYGWIPYSLFSSGQAADAWCVVSEPWVNSGSFLRTLAEADGS